MTDLVRARRVFGIAADTVVDGESFDNFLAGYLDQFGFNLGIAHCANALCSVFAMDPKRIRQANGIEVEWDSSRIERLEKIALQYASASEIQVDGAYGSVTPAVKSEFI